MGSGYQRYRVAEIVRAKIEGQISNLPDYAVEQRTLMGSYINEMFESSVIL